MDRKKQMNTIVKGRILALHDEGLSNRRIAEKINYSEGAVRKFLKKYRETGSVDRIIRSGSVPNRDLRSLKNLCLRNRFASAAELKRDLIGTYFENKSVRTIQRWLNKLGLLSCKAAKKPLLTDQMKRNRLIWARAHENWTLEDWSRVVFSDESRFNLLGPDGSKRVRRKKGERFKENCVQPTVKYSPSVMVWGCVTNYGVGPLIIVEGIMNAEKYKNVINNHVLPTLEDLMQYVRDPIFQDDSAPCHRARSITDLKENLGIISLEWPGNSPDLNPIENLWAILGEKIKEQKPRTLQALKNALIRTWENDISDEIILNLYSSMPSRVEKVRRAKGDHIQY